jgi:polyhydroxyalkanoate synthesis regulator phasin
VSTAEHRIHASKTPITMGVLAKAVDALTAGVRKMMNERDERITQLERRLAELERQREGETLCER